MNHSTESSYCGCHADEERAVADPTYRRALCAVVLLNLGFGVVELIGGFVARSQALKADSLDFLGDGSITFVGLLALESAAKTRGRIALTQGVFLACLGVGVFTTVIWRAAHSLVPEAEIMGGLGLIGLVVNVTAALVLMRFRERRDANVRAIWLFSRNDALANVAVIVAAGIVFWTQSAWPDVIVAVVISTLFLHSAWEIITGSVRDLRTRAS